MSLRLHRLLTLALIAPLAAACGDAAPTEPGPAALDAKAAHGPACGAFDDVGRDHWAYGAIEAGAELGLWSGCGGGGFCPDATALRLRSCWSETSARLTCALACWIRSQ